MTSISLNGTLTSTKNRANPRWPTPWRRSETRLKHEINRAFKKGGHQCREENMADANFDNYLPVVVGIYANSCGELVGNFGRPRVLRKRPKQHAARRTSWKYRPRSN